MGLTNVAIRNAKPGNKPRKLFDGGGLFCSSPQKGSIGGGGLACVQGAAMVRTNAAHSRICDPDLSDSRPGHGECGRASNQGGGDCSPLCHRPRAEHRPQVAVNYLAIMSGRHLFAQPSRTRQQDQQRTQQSGLAAENGV